MDNFEFPDAEAAAIKKKRSAMVWNILTILVLVTIACVVSYFFLIYSNPYSSLNPFPPPTQVPNKSAPTATVTPRFTLVPTWTATPPGAQLTQAATATSTLVATEASTASPTPGVTTVPASSSQYAFAVEQGSPSAIAWTDFHPDAGCDWTGVAGQVISLSNEAASGLLVQLGGSLPGEESIDLSSMTGYAVQYGAGGYEIIIANKLIASEGTLWIQLTDQQKLPLSDKVYFNTYDDCKKNLIIISFIQVQ